MPVSIVIGGQFGSEGKGKVSYCFAQKLNAAAVVRVGGINSGHTVVSPTGEEYIFRTLPTAAIDNSKLCILPSGSYIDIDILRSEINISGIAPENLKIDEYAVVIDKTMIEAERQSNLRERIGSTASGTGVAVITRLEREREGIFAKDCVTLKPYTTDTKKLMRNILNERKHIIIEGTQGFGLSPINSAYYYPHCTSRDTTAAGFLTETGLSPFDVENVIMVIRSYPIRVSGESGELVNETNWQDVTHQSGSTSDLTEHTSATKRIRRIAAFDAEIVKKAIEVNRPNIIVLNHVDYVDYSCHDSDKLTTSVTEFIKKTSKDIGQAVDYVGTGKTDISHVLEGQL
ncbi:adenylosuccinate synthetase [Planctomycetales bacterium]|nr:adenylosuccinate synthetase [Planctomycetales bacterium]GHT08833.1 adenylosuccinate synthetase [Planctomycetales bacterium]